MDRFFSDPAYSTEPGRDRSFERPHTTSKGTNAQTWVFIFLSALSILMCWAPLVGSFRLALATDAYTHLLLILPLGVSLIYSDSRYWDSRKRPFTHQPSFATGVPLLAFSLVIICGARWISASDRLSLGMLGLVIWWIGSIILCFGVETSKSLLFPICFLFLVVPLPPSALNWIVEFLQQQSAAVAYHMFQLARVPVTQNGIMLSIPGLDIEVAPECSSIRSSLMLVVTTAVLAHLFLRSRWRKGLLIAVSVPLSIAKNGLRIFTIAELATRVDSGFLTGKFHRHGGIVFFGIALAAVGLILIVLRRSETQVVLKSSELRQSKFLR
jgi:exosortase